MSKVSFTLMHVIRTMAGAYREDKRGDKELLLRYIDSHDETAFATLMVRHGPMVWGICSRILGNVQDVEDAYQLVFATLAVKGVTIRSKTLASWLHQVAHRTSLNALKTIQSRKRLLAGVKVATEVESMEETSSKEAQEALHDELAKLPEKLRTTLVLHFLEGKLQAEVAAILGITEQTVRNRLVRGRTYLRQRLAGRGVVVGTAALTVLLETACSHAVVPSALANKTIQTVAAFRDGKLTGGIAQLAKEVLKHTPSVTPWWKTGWMVGLLCLGTFGASLTGIAWKAGLFRIEDRGPVNIAKHESSSLAQKEKSKPARVDRYGDPLPPGALVRLGTTRFRHTSENYGLLFMSDGKGLIMCNAGSPASHFDTATGQPIRKFGKDVRGLSLSRDSRILVGRGPDDQDGLCVWDVKTGKLLHQMWAGEMDVNALLALSPDAKNVALAGHNANTCVWDIGAGKVVWEKDWKKEVEKKTWAEPYSLTYSADGKELVVLDREGIRILNAGTGKDLRRFGKKDKHSNLDGACSPDGRVAAVGYQRYEEADDSDALDYRERSLSLWDVAAGKELLRLTDAKIWSDAGAMAFSPDCKILATDHTRCIRLWDVKTGKQLRSIPKRVGDLAHLVFPPNGQLIAGANRYWNDSSVHVWDVESGREVAPALDGHTSFVVSVAFASDGREIVSGGADGTFRTWNATTGTKGPRLAQMAESLFPVIVTGSVSSDGQTVAGVERLERERVMRVIRQRGGRTQEICRLPVDVNMFCHMSLSPDNKIVAISADGKANTHLVDLSSGKVVRTILGDRPTFSPDGRMLAAVGQKGDTETNNLTGAVCLWSVESGKEICAFRIIDKTSLDAIKGLAFSPDMRLMAVATTDGKIGLWRLVVGQSLDGKAAIRVTTRQLMTIESGTLLRPSSGFIARLTFSPDSRLLAFVDSDGLIHVWDTATGKARCGFQGHGGEILSLAFSPEGRRLATGSRDATILVWDVTNGNLDPSGGLRSLSCTAKEMEALWDDLIHSDDRRADQAVWKLASAGAPAVAFLNEHMDPSGWQAPDKKLVDQWISDLNSETYAVREQARQKLANLGEAVTPALYQALRGRPSVHAHRVLQLLIKEIDDQRTKLAVKGQKLRGLRAVEVLGHIATGDARRVLDRLAAGDPAAPHVQTAKFALRKVAR